MKVVADTSPIHYLILIDQTDLLTGLFGRVFIPPAVEAELRHPSAPAVVRQTIAERPGLFGLLVRGAQLGMIDFDQAVERLTATNFRLDPRLIHLYRASLP